MEINKNNKREYSFTSRTITGEQALKISDKAKSLLKLLELNNNLSSMLALHSASYNL